MKKYLVNDLPNQTIAGNLRIDGDLRITDGTYSFATYRALLTQTATFSGSSIYAFNSSFIIGETYTIEDYVELDDFSNISNVIFGTANSTGCQFIATGELPLKWGMGSTVTSSGNLLVEVLENNLGYDIEWTTFMTGVYLGFKSYPGRSFNGGLFNDWPRSTTSVNISQSSIILYSPPIGPVIQFAGPSPFGTKDACISVINYDYGTQDAAGNWLYYTPIEIKVKQNLETTPIAISGLIDSGYPFSNVAFDFIEDGFILTDTIYTEDPTVVNNILELIDLLNANANANYFGTYAEDGIGGITLTMPTNLKRQFSPSGTLSIAIYAD